jgi:hypothetical protein
MVADAYIGTFYRMCLNDGFQVSLMEEMAAQLGWEELSAEFVDAFESDVVPQSLRAWVVDVPQEAPPFIGFAGRSPANQAPAIEYCAAYFARLDGAYFLAAVITDARAQIMSRTDILGGFFAQLSLPDYPSQSLELVFWSSDVPLFGTYAIVAFDAG